MIRVAIDTNVLVSALLTSGGLPEAVIDLAISGAVQWFASESVLAEYELDKLVAKSDVTLLTFGELAEKYLSQYTR